MGLISRFVRVLKSKFNKVLSSQEDPVEQLEYTYQQMQDNRYDVKESITDIVTQRKKLESKKETFEEDIKTHNRQAREAMSQDREDLARAALEKKKSKAAAVENITDQIVEMKNVEDEMKEKLSEIEDRLNELSTEKEILKARHEGAEAMKDVNESLTEGVGDFSVEDAVEDVEEEITTMQSRAEAVSELNEDDKSLDEELEELTGDADVEEELDSLRGEVSDVEPIEDKDSLEREVA